MSESTIIITGTATIVAFGHVLITSDNATVKMHDPRGLVPRSAVGQEVTVQARPVEDGQGDRRFVIAELMSEPARATVTKTTQVFPGTYEVSLSNGKKFRVYKRTSSWTFADAFDTARGEFRTRTAAIEAGVTFFSGR